MAAMTGIATAMPSNPPSTEIATDSLTKIESTRCLVNPSVFSTATSRVRLRTDIAMVFAETSMMANMTAPQMPRMNAFSLSVFVCSGELRNMSSISLATLATSSAESTWEEYQYVLPLNQSHDSSRYLALK